MGTVMNNRTRKIIAASFVTLALITTAISPALGQTKRKPHLRRTTRVTRKVTPSSTPAPVYYSVNAGQTIRVRMNQTISSETARIGDQFTTTVVDPIYAGGVEVVPAGSTVTGQVTSVQRAARQSKAGTLGVHFVSLRLPGGIARSINGELTSAGASESVNADNEGEVSGRSATKRNVVFIGGGAATGAIIGAIAGGGKGAGIGAGIGAGLGVAGALFSKGHEAVVKPGTEFGVILNQPISLPAANVR